jgi:hypothetical protein
MTHTLNLTKRLNAFLIIFFFAVTAFSSSLYADAVLEVDKHIGWNIIGLDSNKPADSGPDTFAVGYRYCNTGDTIAYNVEATFKWDETTNTTLITLQNSTSLLSVAEILPLGGGISYPDNCYDFYYNILVDRYDGDPYDKSRDFHIEVVHSTNTTPVESPADEEIFIEHLVSQNRNSINSITGPSTVIQGYTYTFVDPVQ